MRLLPEGSSALGGLIEQSRGAVAVPRAGHRIDPILGSILSSPPTSEARFVVGDVRVGDLRLIRLGSVCVRLRRGVHPG